MFISEPVIKIKAENIDIDITKFPTITLGHFLKTGKKNMEPDFKKKVKKIGNYHVNAKKNKQGDALTASLFAEYYEKMKVEKEMVKIFSKKMDLLLEPLTREGVEWRDKKYRNSIKALFSQSWVAASKKKHNSWKTVMIKQHDDYGIATGQTMDVDVEVK